MTNIQDLSEARFQSYISHLCDVIGHRDRHEPLKSYIMGLCLPGERKSIEPMAARLDPRHVSSLHQSMHHLISRSPWNDRAIIRVTRQTVLDQMERHGGVMAWVLDDTGIPKKGTHSVGVARQYCGLLGKQDNCQVVVSLSLANSVVSIPSAYRLFLPESWAQDATRRKKVGVPEEITFKSKIQIAMDLINQLRAEGIPWAPIVGDAGYGNATWFRDALSSLECPQFYALAIRKDTTVWPSGEQPLAPKPYSGKGRRPSKLRRDSNHQPMTVFKLAKSLPLDEWNEMSWREGTKGLMSSRFAMVRVRPAHGDTKRETPRDEEWLLIEWPVGQSTPEGYWLSTLPEDTTLEMLVRLVKIRWRIERDYQELKSEFGLDQFEGRGWRGLHHHWALCIATYAFMAAERASFSPPEPLAFLQKPPVPEGFRPRGSPCTT